MSYRFRVAMAAPRADNDRDGYYEDRTRTDCDLVSHPYRAWIPYPDSNRRDDVIDDGSVPAVIPAHIAYYALPPRQPAVPVPRLPLVPPPEGWTMEELPTSVQELVERHPQVLLPNAETRRLGEYYARKDEANKIDRRLPLLIPGLARNALRTTANEDAGTRVLWQASIAEAGRNAFRDAFVANIKDNGNLVQLVRSNVEIIQSQLKSLLDTAPAGQHDMSQNRPGLNDCIASRLEILWSETFWWRVFEQELHLSKLALERLEAAGDYAILEDALPNMSEDEKFTQHPRVYHRQQKLWDEFYLLRDGLKAVAFAIEKYTGDKKFLSRHEYELLDLCGSLNEAASN